jgi:hypothetical protein
METAIKNLNEWVMRKYYFIVFGFLFGIYNASAQIDSLFPVRGFCIAAPSPAGVDSFVTFIEKELAPRQVNTLILRVDYAYQYTSHPELREKQSLSKEEVKKLVAACKRNRIRIIPQVNLLGHQSWAGRIGKLLEVYPDFDETPHVAMPQNYKWPNADSLYCKSYCPLHPGVHKVVFDIVDEICDVFETNAFHAGMDEVFYIGDSKCPRCSGKDKAVLFAGEVTKLRNHLAEKNRTLWIWGDRLLDGKTTGLGMWEGSFNNTYTAIDIIPKDVMICDWHYERADKTAVYFAMKGLSVVTCPWRDPQVAIKQANDMAGFRLQSTKEMKPRFQGMLQTVWSDAQSFLRGFYSMQKSQAGDTNTQWHCFVALFDRINMVK